MAKPIKSTSATAVSAESIALPAIEQAATAPITNEQAILHLKEALGIPSVQLVERALNAALVASRACSRHGDDNAAMRAAGVPFIEGKRATGRERTVSQAEPAAKAAYLKKVGTDKAASIRDNAAKAEAARLLGIC